MSDAYNPDRLRSASERDELNRYIAHFELRGQKTMPTRTFPITSYTITLGDKLGATFGKTAIKARGIVSCIGPDNQRVVAYFLAADSPVPAPTTTIGGKWGPIFLPQDLIGSWVDMLRNEKPLTGYINTDHPEWTNVSTGDEPIGEGEG